MNQTQDTTIWIKDQNKNIILYDIFTTNANGDLDYQFVVDDRFSSGTYTAIIKQEGGGSDAALFGIEQISNNKYYSIDG